MSPSPPRAVGEPSEFFKILLHGCPYIGETHSCRWMILDLIKAISLSIKPSVQFFQRAIHMQQLPHRNLPQQYDDLGVNDFDLMPEPRAVTGSQLVITWSPVIRRTAFDTVCDKYPATLQITSVE
jgi:hypothetical protein